MRAALVAIVLLGFVTLATSPWAPAGSNEAAAARSNPIVLENAKPGSTGWEISGRLATDERAEIKGYASAVSVNHGQSITLFVSVHPAQTYSIDVYRIGWYGGAGGRLVRHAGPLRGSPQPACPLDAATGMVECNWAPALRLTTGRAWTTGVYVALLTSARRFQNYVIFVVRNDGRAADVVYQQPVTTYQAYNNYPATGSLAKSLYAFNSHGPLTTISGKQAALKVSFDRPYTDSGAGDFFKWEINFVRWLERSGIDVDYATDIDTDAAPGRLRRSKAFLSVGHDEYWSRRMYDAVVAARDAGTSLGFFGADEIGWQVRFEPSRTGRPYRVMVCYKYDAEDPTPDPALRTIRWEDALDRPPQTLVGLGGGAQLVPPRDYVAYVVADAANWIYSGTGLRNGDRVRGIVGYEVDRHSGTTPAPTVRPGKYALLSHSPVVDKSGAHDYANSSIYQAPSGAWVFAAGTIAWAWSLDPLAGRPADARLQRATANILERMIGRNR
jgi:hypothetical protein